MNQSLRNELERSGKNVDQLLSAKGALASSLEQARARLRALSYSPGDVVHLSYMDLRV